MSPDSTTEPSEPGVPCERCLETWVLPRMRSTPDDDRDKADAKHHLDRQRTTPSGLPAIRPVQGPAFGLELEELLEAKLLCFFTIVFLKLRKVIDAFPPGGSSPRLGMAH